MGLVRSRGRWFKVIEFRVAMWVEIRGKEGSRFGLLVWVDELFLLADAGFG